MIKFSIVIPYYNSSTTINECLTSCLNQSYPPFEIIIVDDCSTDNYLSNLNKPCNDERIRIIRFEKNTGQSAARNAGWSMAKGDFVVFSDADDFLHPHRLKILADIITANNNCNVIGNKCDVPNNIPDEYIKISNSSFKILKLHHLIFRSPIGASSLTVRKQFPLRFDENMRYTEDHDFLLRSSLHDDIFFIPQCLTFIKRPQLEKGGLSGNVWAMRKGEMKMYSKFCFTNPKYLFFYPLLICFSFCKHLTKIKYW